MLGGIKEKYYDLVVSDFDGTLFSAANGICKNTLFAIKKFIAAGGVFCVATGRMTSSIIKFYKEYGFRGYVISFNGAEICNTDTGEKVFKRHVDNFTCAKLLEYAEREGHRIQVYPDDVLTVNGLNDDYRAYAKRCHVSICDCDEPVSNLFKRKNLTSGKVLFYTNDSLRGKMLAEIKNVVGDEYEVICSNHEHIDVMAKGISKGAAVLKLCEILGKSSERLVCFGDEMNDASMLQIAALGVATKNGNENLKKIADVIVPPCEKGGVGIGIEKFCIG